MSFIGLTISLPHGDGNGVDYVNADTTMDFQDVAYNTVHSFKGGVHAIADRIGVNPHTLSHKVNPNNKTNHLTLHEAVLIMEAADNVGILQAVAARLGYVLTRMTPSVHESPTPVDSTADFLSGAADFLDSVADAVRDKQHITPQEMRRIEFTAQELQSRIAQTVLMSRNRMRRQPPKPDYAD